MQDACQPVCLADPNAGSKRAASIAIIAITTSSSINVNPLVAFAAVRAGVRISFLLQYIIHINTVHSIIVYTKKPPEESWG
jgi:hypothetical protein